MRIAFVTGATGYTGREVVRLAVEAGLKTVAHVRPDSRRLDEWRDRFVAMGAEVDTTAWEESALTARFATLGPTVVFALLGTTRARGKAEKRETGVASTYVSVDYGLTAMLRRAAAAMTEPPRFVYLSTMGIGAAPPEGSYMHARFKIESELEEGSMPYTVARPSFITGDDRDEARAGERVGSAIADGALAIAGLFGAKKLRDNYRSTTNTTLAGALVRLALDEAAANTVVESRDLQ
jgi:nucleoside-diphosphate-sugar epimerase